MAADLNLEWICSLPRSWTYGITRGGRVFFINEEAKSTTWLHPVTGEAVVTGHRRQSTDLPTGWEEAYTFEGARYYIKYETCGGRGRGDSSSSSDKSKYDLANASSTEETISSINIC
ncbi:pleckstrin homology domain-containing family A member 5 isoform X24 [Halichoerus grypus]